MTEEMVSKRKKYIYRQKEDKQAKNNVGHLQMYEFSLG